MDTNYYDDLLRPELRSVLSHPSGIVYAKVGGHSFWPARISTVEEYESMSKYCTKAHQICVYFFGTNNFGWVNTSNITTFAKGVLPTTTTNKKAKYNSAKFKSAVALATVAYNEFNESLPSFIEKLKQERSVAKTTTTITADDAGADQNNNCLECSTNLYSSSSPITKCKSCCKYFHTQCRNAKDNYCSSCSKNTSKKASKSSKKSPEKKSKKSPEKIEKKSDDKCFICSLGGELLVCDAPNCTRVYHRLCLGHYPFNTTTDDDDECWKCPQHVCVVTGDVQKLVKCTTCPVAVSRRVLKNQYADFFQCPNCASPSPVLKLNQILERVWSVMATNPQSLPFYSPLLPGVPREGLLENDDITFLSILLKIRRQEYVSPDSFLSDIKRMVDKAKEIVSLHHNNGSTTTTSNAITEAADTVLLVTTETLERQRHVIDKLKLSDHHHHHWLKWRKECSLANDKGAFASSRTYVDERTFMEWTHYVANVPHDLYNHAKTVSPNKTTAAPIGISVISEGEKLDIADALASLRSDSKNSTKAREYFLSPSSHEMENMFIRQSKLLRQCLEGHAAIKHAWETSQETIFTTKERVITLGEGRLAAELRLANENLKARLDRKNSLIEKLHREHQVVLAQLKALKEGSETSKLNEPRASTNNNSISSISSSSSHNGKKRRRTSGRPRRFIDN